MKIKTYVFGLFILLLSNANLNLGYTASFSADMTEIKNGQTQTFPFHYRDKSYRYETAADGSTLVIIVDNQSGMTRVLLPSGKNYIEMKSDDLRMALNEPFSLCALSARNNEVRMEGSESILGHPCSKQVYLANGQVFITAWISDEFAFPFKIENVLYGITVELSNIRTEPQDPSLFTIPSDYVMTPQMPEPLPEWAKQVKDSPVLTPSFEKNLNEGEIIIIRPKAGYKITLNATNVHKETSTLTVVPFKNGNPVHDPMMTTCSFEPKDSVKMENSETPDEADDIVVRISKGKIALKATFDLSSKTDSDSTNNPDTKTDSLPANRADISTNDMAQIVSSPDSVRVAAQFEVSWNGPGNKEDYVTVARPEQPPAAYINRTMLKEGNPVKIWSPSDPGQYEIRYILGKGAKILANQPITVNPAEASVETPGFANMGDWIEVKWTGPEVLGDHITVAHLNQPPGAYINQSPIKNSLPVKVRAPGEPGEYEVRYILGRGSKLLAKSSITIKAVTAKVESPAFAVTGTEFQVGWQGPGYNEDYISVAQTNQPPGAYISHCSIRKGNPLKIKAPKLPGTYEVRYIMGKGSKLLDKITILIESEKKETEKPAK